MIDVNKAKQKILDLAIRGKLTKQLKSDGDAADLLVKIQKEKEKLIKQGRIRKDKKEAYIYKNKKDNLYYEKFITTETDILNKNVVAKQSEPDEKCINDELPFEIPKNWVWCKIGSVVENIIAGGDKPKNMKKLQDEKYVIPVYSNGERDDGLFGFTDKPKVMPPAITISARGTIGYTVFRYEPFVPIVRLITITSKHSELLKYISYYIKTNLVDSNGSTTQQITLPMLTSMLIPLPPLVEQNRIVEKVDKLFDILDKIDEAQKKHKKDKDVLKSKIIEAGIKGKLTKQLKSDGDASDLLDEIRKEKEKLIKEGKIKRDKKETYIYKNPKDNLYYEKYQDGTEKCIQDELPFEIPDNWVWCRASQLLYLIAGTSYNKADIKSDGIRILRGGNIVANQLVLFEDDVFVSDSYQDEVKNVYKGDIILVASTGSKITIGKPARILVNHHKTQIGAFLRIARMYKNSISNYIWYIFNSSYYKNHILESVKGTNISNIKNEYIEDMLIPLSSLGEQERIVKIMEVVLNKLGNDSNKGDYER